MYRWLMLTSNEYCMITGIKMIVLKVLYLICWWRHEVPAVFSVTGGLWYPEMHVMSWYLHKDMLFLFSSVEKNLFLSRVTFFIYILFFSWERHHRNWANHTHRETSAPGKEIPPSLHTLPKDALRPRFKAGRRIPQVKWRISPFGSIHITTSSTRTSSPIQGWRLSYPASSSSASPTKTLSLHSPDSARSH